MTAGFPVLLPAERRGRSGYSAESTGPDNGEISTVPGGAPQGFVLVLSGAKRHPGSRKPEKKPPCSQLYIPDQKSLLFRVSYHRNRINFEVYHALTDGTGAMNFVTELVQDYLILAHPEDKLPWIELADEGDSRRAGRGQFFTVLFVKNPKKQREKTTGSAAERRETDSLRYADHGSHFFGERDSGKSPFL